MSKIDLPTVTGGYNLSTINNNFQRIAQELNDKVLYRNNPIGEANELITDLDANGKRVYNVPTPVEDHEAVNFETLKKYTYFLPDIEKYLEELVDEAEGHSNDAEASANAAAVSAGEAAQSAVDAQNSAQQSQIQANRAESEADRAELAATSVIDVLNDGSPNYSIHNTKAELDAFVPPVYPAIGRVLDGPEAGYYKNQDNGLGWVWLDPQPLTDRDVLELYIIQGTPVNTGYEFHNTYPADPTISSKAKLFIDVNGHVIGSVEITGEWNLYGISTASPGVSSGAGYEFHNTLDVGGIAKAYIDRNDKVFANFDVEGQFTFIGQGGASSSGGDGKFPLNLLTQILAFIFYGQSLSVGAQGQPVLSLAQPYGNYTFGAGPKATKAGSTGSNPGTDTIKLLVEDTLNGDQGEGGNRGETQCSGAANYASVVLSQEGINPFDCPIFSSTAGHGGYSIAQLKEDSEWFQVWKDHITESAARIQELGKEPIYPVVTWIQGESNASTAWTTYAAQLISLRQAQADFIRSINRQTWDPPMHMYQTYSSSTTENGSANAQLWLARNYPTKFRIVTPTYIFPHVADGTHLTNVGYKWMGAYFGRAFADVVLNREPVNYIMPGIPVKEGLTTIRIPHKSGFDLQFETNVQDRGYKVTANGADKVLSSVVLDGKDVVLTMASPISSMDVEVVVTYARAYKNPNLLPINGGCGDLCDTDPTEVVIDGISRSLRTYCPSFRAVAITLTI